MSMPINRSSDQPLSLVESEERYRLLLETHMGWLQEQSDTIVHPVDLGLANRYKYDLIGYLTAHSIPRTCHYSIMRINAMTSPMEFTDKRATLIIPTAKSVGKLKAFYMTSRSQIN